MAVFQMACNRAEWACGCVTWLKWESGAWAPKRSRHWLCRLHEEGQP